jgi:hypothetical protein
MDEMTYDEIIKKMLADQSTPEFSAGAQLQPGLLGETPASTQPSTPVNANASAENILTSMQNKNQANTQNMMETGQQGLQTAMQASQGLQAQRQSDMDATAQQAAQALQQQQQSEAGLGRFIGGLLNKFLIPVKFGGGRK